MKKRTGRKFVCGDIHGCYDKLMEGLAAKGFDFETDTLYALGDLVDRGTQNMEVLRLLNEPWFDSIKGNHELMLEVAYLGQDVHDMHANNGGRWFRRLDRAQRKEAYDLVIDLPIAMHVIGPSGRTYGLVHAEIPGNDWAEFEAMLESGNEAQFEAASAVALWGRTKVKNVQSRRAPVGAVRGVDMVYMGHTPLQRVLQHENLRWIDTGACWNDGSLTIEELV